MGRSSGKSKDFLPLTRSSYGLALKWDNLDGKGIDCDLQAVLVDDRGHIIDAVYYNNMTALQGAIGLIGDTTTGEGDGYDEQIYLTLKKFQPQVKLVIFVVAVYDKRRSLDDVDNGQVVLLEEGRPMKQFKLERSDDGSADVVALMKLELDGTWAFFQVQVPAEGGSHFMDILEPTIGDIIRHEIPHAPKVQKVSFLMDKDARVSLPATSKLKRLSVGIGGSLQPLSTEEVDMEIAAVFWSTKGKPMGAVDSLSDGMCGVEHTGEMENDDEMITIDLAQIPAEVDRIFMVLTVSGGTFAKVSQAYARIADQTSMELVRYDIDGGCEETGLIMGQLLRGLRRRWTFEAVGHYFSPPCCTWKGGTDLMSKLFKGEKLAPPSGEKKAVPFKDTTERKIEREAKEKASEGAAHTHIRRPQVSEVGSYKMLSDTSKAPSPRSDASPPGAPTPKSGGSTPHRKGCVRLQGRAATTQIDASDMVNAESREDEEGASRQRACGAVCRSGLFGACSGTAA